MRGSGPAGDGLEGDRLFESLSRGEPRALDEVCRRYGERVARILRRLLGPALRRRMESADLAQEALMDIVLGLKDNRFESERSFLSWIRVVVEHRVVGAARRMSAAKRGSGREVNLGSHLDLGDPWCERPSQIVGRREEADRLNRAIAALPGPDREVIVARLLLELPWPAVAASTGASLEAVQMRFLRARRRLAGVLKGAEAKMPGPSSGTKRGELHGSSYPRRDRFFPSLVASRSGPRR